MQVRRVEPMYFGCAELVELHGSTYSSRRARHVRCRVVSRREWRDEQSGIWAIIVSRPSFFINVWHTQSIHMKKKQKSNNNAAQLIHVSKQQKFFLNMLLTIRGIVKLWERFRRLWLLIFSAGISWWRTWFGLCNMELNRLVSRASTRLEKSGKLRGR